MAYSCRLALSSAEAFRTPLGDIPLDRQAVDKILEFPQAQIIDVAHDMEHSLEVHLPFLQRVLGDFSLVPVAVGEATPDEVADVMDAELAIKNAPAREATAFLVPKVIGEEDEG